MQDGIVRWKGAQPALISIKMQKNELLENLQNYKEYFYVCHKNSQKDSRH